MAIRCECHASRRGGQGHGKALAEEDSPLCDCAQGGTPACVAMVWYCWRVGGCLIYLARQQEEPYGSLRAQACDKGLVHVSVCRGERERHTHTQRQRKGETGIHVPRAG